MAGAGDMMTERRVFAFIFPMASGHINPSLAVARSLVSMGHEVHYLCREQMRQAIEDTGAKFHSDVELERELYEGREPDLHGATETLKKEFALEHDNMFEAMTKLNHIQLEMMLPGVVRWLRILDASAIAYCPMMNREAAYAARALGIPSVAVHTIAGPGAAPKAFKEFLEMCGTTEERLQEAQETFKPGLEALERINQRYGLSIPACENIRPLGKLDVLKHSFVTLVTTSEDLQDPMTPKLAEAYERDRVRFEAVGPLLDEEGATRAAGHKFKDVSDSASHRSESDRVQGADVVAQVREAKAAGRQVILVSMGTVITGDSPDVGWEGRLAGRGLTGRELCRGAWAGAFDAFGQARADEGALLVVALGPQKDALGDVVAPRNSVCLPVLPQVDILKNGVDVFLTHGGQNSFTEGLANGTPVVVCPGFGDQKVNAQKAEALGVGVQVPRPEPEEGQEAVAAAQYSSDVARALKRVSSESSFSIQAQKCSERLQKSGGVPRAVELMLSAAGTRQQAMLSKDGAHAQVGIGFAKTTFAGA